jgi:hypothetical protein
MYLYVGAPSVLAYMIPRVKKRLQEAHRPATKRNQQMALHAFLMFLIFHELPVKNIQIFTVLAFIEFLAFSKFSPPTIKNYISSIKSKLNILGIKTRAFQSPRVVIAITSLCKNKILQVKPKPIITPVQFQTLYLNAETLPLKAFVRVAILRLSGLSWHI